MARGVKGSGRRKKMGGSRVRVKAHTRRKRK